MVRGHKDNLGSLDKPGLPGPASGPKGPMPLENRKLKDAKRHREPGSNPKNMKFQTWAHHGTTAQSSLCLGRSFILTATIAVKTAINPLQLIHLFWGDVRGARLIALASSIFNLSAQQAQHRQQQCPWFPSKLPQSCEGPPRRGTELFLHYPELFLRSQAGSSLLCYSQLWMHFCGEHLSPESRMGMPAHLCASHRMFRRS